MTASTRTTATTAPSRPTGRHWLTDWRPEDRDFWSRTGARTARRNLVVSIFTEHIGFSIWSLWSVFVLFLTPEYGLSADPKTAVAQKFLLTTLPTALGAAVRIPYTFAVTRFGGRTWTIASALLLLVPAVVTAAVLRPGTSYGTLLVLAALTGVGGGNFASSMANINSFYPQRLKGRALGLNAGGGNIGVAAVQLVGLAVLATAGKSHPRVLLGIYIPLIVLGALLAALLMDNIAAVRADQHALRDASRDPHTWLIAVLYVGTFGSFIGFGFAFGQVLQNQFAPHFLSAATGKVDPVRIAGLTFLGPLVGSLSRPIGGWLSDRLDAGRTTLATFVAMTAATGLVLGASRGGSLGLFYVGFIALFVLSGVGNGSTYKMIPGVFRARTIARLGEDADPAQVEREARRLSNAVIGIAGAAGAFGGVLVNIAFRQSFLHAGNGNAAYVGFLAFYLSCVALTWAVYLRPGASWVRRPVTPTRREPAMTIYDSIGGAPAVAAAVDAFYPRLLSDPQLAPFFAGVDVNRLKSHQRSFIAAALGGSEIYAGRDMAAAHAGLGISDDHFDAVVSHLAATLTDLGVPASTIAQIGTALAPLRSDIVTAPPAELAG